MILSIRVTSLKMLLGQGGPLGVGDHILMVLQCQGQGTELVDSMVAEESVEQRAELLVLLSQGGSHGVWKVRDHWLVVEPKNSWLCFMGNSSSLMA